MLACATGGAWAANVFFTGKENNYFNLAGNWDIGRLPTSDTIFFQGNKFNSRFTENEVVFDTAYTISKQFSVRAVGTADNPLVWRATNADYGLKSTANNSLVGWNVGDAYLLISNGTWQVAGSAFEIGDSNKGWLYLKDIKAFTISKDLMLKNSSTLTLDGGSISVGTSLQINGGSVLNLTSGSITVGNGYNLRLGGEKNKSASYIQKSGTLECADIYLGNNANSTSGEQYFELGGGMVTAGAIVHGEGNAPATIKFDGGTLRARIAYPAGLLREDTRVSHIVGDNGGTIDSNNLAINIGASINDADGESGTMTFKGGNTVTLTETATIGWTGGTIVELGTKLSVGSGDARDAILANGLKVEYGKVLTDGDYTVFEYSRGLPDDALEKVELVNCGVDTTIGLNDDATGIVVHFVAPKWISDTASTRVWTGTLDDVAFGKFTARFGGKSCNFSDYAHSNAVDGYNKKVFVDDSGRVTEIIVEYQVKETGIIKGVIVSFTNGEDGVYATALDAKYIANQNYAGDFEFYKYSKEWATGITDYNIVASNNTHGYGVYDLRVTADATAEIEKKAEGVLEISGQGDVGQLITPSINLEIASESKIAADNFHGQSKIVNHGTVDFKGRECSIPFDMASTGIYVVSNGVLKAKKVVETGRALTIKVASGAEYDINDRAVTASVVLEDGATFTNGGSSHVHWDTAQSWSLTLNGNATANANINFGLVAKNNNEYEGTSLYLNNHTLTLTGKNNFILNKTTVSGSGKVVVEAGKLVAVNGTYGENWSVVVNQKGSLWLYTPQNKNPTNLTVCNFENRGTIDTNANHGETGTLVVRGTLTPGNAIPKLQLSDGAIVTVKEGVTQEISTEFSASGTIKVDFSAITDASGLIGNGISVLKVPSAQIPSNVTWEPINAPVSKLCARWVNGSDGYSTLKIRQNSALFIRIR